MSANPTIPERYANQQVGAIGYRVLNLDLDGVCADYTGAMRDYLVRHGQMDPHTIPANTSYALTDNDGWPFANTADYIAAHKAAEDTLAADGGDKRHLRAGAAEDIGDVIGAAAHGKALGMGMDIFLRLGQMVDAEDDVHAGGTDNKHILHT